MTCAKCNDTGDLGIVEWADGNGTNHRALRWCDCDTARSRLDALARKADTYCDRIYGGRP